MPLEKGQIRLLTLRQGSNQDDLIECELSSCELNSAPAYEALSYYWGTTESDRVISLHGSQFRVRDDLYKALQHLRHGQTSRVLWIDWICIDQRNQAEIYEQISQLGEICAKAESVVVYLGEATDATDQAMDYLMQIQEGETSQISPGIMDNVVLEGCQDILSRPWFQRAWILQDAFYARAAVLHCGSKAVLSKTMIYISKSIPDKIDPLSQHVLNLMPGSRGDDEAASKIPLYDLLQRFRFSKATDQRDKIYALLGIVGFEPPKSIILPDYSMSQKDLMRAVLAHLCFCEPSSVPEPPYETIDEFLANLDPIDNDILKKMFETSRDIDLVSLLRHGSHYISIDRSLVEAAGRNKTKGDEMAKLLRAAIDSKRSAVPTSPEVSWLF
ncbi:heterokaryon incompatibility protein-domain-containing protein [Leptodontidium sp. MPI-SDFR-AT-0119]|nr:heterokaryon incompatibility protein-domain-containing protein [Leptodontidium sp. MPI-SDFR-AT-0119]